MPLLTQNGFGGHRDANDLISMVSFTLAMRRHFIRLASAPFTSFRLTQFGWVPFAYLRVQRLATKHAHRIYNRVLENSGPILARLWTKDREILERRRRALLHFQRLCPFVYVAFRLEDIRH